MGRGGFIYVKKAAVVGYYSEAESFYGFVSFYGIGCEQDIDEGLKFLRRGVESNCSYAKENLGEILYEGRGGVPADKDNALKLLREAKESGIEDAVIFFKEHGEE